MRHILRVEGQTHHVALAGPASARTLLLDESYIAALLTQRVGSEASLTINGRCMVIHLAGTDDCRFIWLDGEVYEVAVLEPLTVHARAASAAGGLEARAPMPGNVVALPVSVGDTVLAGATLVIIESMKLEVAIKAPQTGRVAEIRCAVGRSFDKDAVLVLLAPEMES